VDLPINMDDLEQLAERLRREDFDARTDVFDGQVGLIVGPAGLELKRLPPGQTGLFLPLWELNHPANRPLVAAKQFHEIRDRRPANWQPRN
jgi:hypothetical protein